MCFKVPCGGHKTSPELHRSTGYICLFLRITFIFNENLLKSVLVESGQCRTFYFFSETGSGTELSQFLRIFPTTFSMKLSLLFMAFDIEIPHGIP